MYLKGRSGDRGNDFQSQSGRGTGGRGLPERERGWRKGDRNRGGYAGRQEDENESQPQDWARRCHRSNNQDDYDTGENHFQEGKY